MSIEHLRVAQLIVALVGFFLSAWAHYQAVGDWSAIHSIKITRVQAYIAWESIIREGLVSIAQLCVVLLAIESLHGDVCVDATLFDTYISRGLLVAISCCLMLKSWLGIQVRRTVQQVVKEENINAEHR